MTATKVHLIQAPYDYGFSRPRLGPGRGPLRYLEAGVADDLRHQGFEVSVESVERRGATEEIPAAVVDGNQVLAAAVARAVAAEAFPLVLSGSCSASLGVLAGLNEPVGIVWFDAHGDFNTPETTPSGFFDGMPLAVATGLCYRDVWDGIASLPPVPAAHTLLVGVRDLDPGERQNLHHSGVLMVTAGELRRQGVRAALNPKLDILLSRVQEVYLHFDIDALDPELAPGVDYKAPGGLLLGEAEEALRLVTRRLRVRAATLAAYNPDCEVEDRTLTAGLHLLLVLALALSNPRP